MFVAAWLALLLAVRLVPGLHHAAGAPGVLLALAAVSAVLEAVSPHGWDNATLPVIPAWLTAWVLRGGG